MKRPRSKRVPGIDRPLLALLAFLPWALLMAGGGIHNHALAVVGHQAGADSSGPPGAPGFHQDRAASSDAPCIACLWQLQSGAASQISPDIPAEPVAPFRAPACKGHLREAEALSFDPRAPPLS